MHHFMSTPMPSTSTKCHTLSTALLLFHLSFLSPYNSRLFFPSLLFPLDDGAELVFAPSSLSSLSLHSLLLCSFWGGRQATFHKEAQAPFSDTSQRYTPPSSLYSSSQAHQYSPLLPMCYLLAPPFTLIPSGCMSHFPNSSPLHTHFLMCPLTIYSSYHRPC